MTLVASALSLDSKNLVSKVRSAVRSSKSLSTKKGGSSIVILSRVSDSFLRMDLPSFYIPRTKSRLSLSLKGLSRRLLFAEQWEVAGLCRRAPEDCGEWPFSAQAASNSAWWFTASFSSLCLSSGPAYSLRQSLNSSRRVRTPQSMGRVTNYSSRFSNYARFTLVSSALFRASSCRSTLSSLLSSFTNFQWVSSDIYMPLNSAQGSTRPSRMSSSSLIRLASSTRRSSSAFRSSSASISFFISRWRNSTYSGLESWVLARPNSSRASSSRCWSSACWERTRLSVLSNSSQTEPRRCSRSAICCSLDLSSILVLRPRSSIEPLRQQSSSSFLLRIESTMDLVSSFMFLRESTTRLESESARWLMLLSPASITSARSTKVLSCTRSASAEVVSSWKARKPFLNFQNRSKSERSTSSSRLLCELNMFTSSSFSLRISSRRAVFIIFWDSLASTLLSYWSRTLCISLRRVSTRLSCIAAKVCLTQSRSLPQLARSTFSSQRALSLAPSSATFSRRSRGAYSLLISSLTFIISSGPTLLSISFSIALVRICIFVSLLSSSIMACWPRVVVSLEFLTTLAIFSCFSPSRLYRRFSPVQMQVFSSLSSMVRLAAFTSTSFSLFVTCSIQSHFQSVLLYTVMNIELELDSARRGLAQAQAEFARLRTHLQQLSHSLKTTLHMPDVLALLDSKILSIAAAADKMLLAVEAGQAQLRHQLQTLFDRLNKPQNEVNSAQLSNLQSRVQMQQNNQKTIHALLARVAQLQSKGLQCKICQNKGRQKENVAVFESSNLERVASTSALSVDCSGIKKARKKIFPDRTNERTAGPEVGQRMASCGRIVPAPKPSCDKPTENWSPGLRNVEACLLSPIRCVQERFNSDSKGWQAEGSGRGYQQFEDFKLSEASSEGDDELFYPGSSRGRDEVHSPFEIQLQ